MLITQGLQQEEALVRIQEQISQAREKLQIINSIAVDYTGNRFDDTLMAVSADNKRDYWESRILELESLLAQYSARTNSTSSDSVKEVLVGDIVVLEMPNGTTARLKIVDRVDFHRGERCITASSPLGSAILGRKPGDSIKVGY